MQKTAAVSALVESLSQHTVEAVVTLGFRELLENLMKTTMAVSRTKHKYFAELEWERLPKLLAMSKLVIGRWSTASLVQITCLGTP